MMENDPKLDDAVTGQSEYVLVPRAPTQAMIKAAYWSAYDEDAEGVWEKMISTYEEGSSKNGNST